VHWILVVLAVLVAAVSLLGTSSATSGVWMIGVACLLAVFARMVQAGEHHAAIIKVTKEPEGRRP
jgi:hypothetical protein